MFYDSGCCMCFFVFTNTEDKPAVRTVDEMLVGVTDDEAKKYGIIDEVLK